MKERPILFSAPMVRAILDGSKTQTRRAAKGFSLELLKMHNGFNAEFVALPENHLCPYGYQGDRLWVREGFSGPHYQSKCRPSEWSDSDPIWYWADGNPEGGDWTRNKPSIHMPRWASRILLEVTGVRVEKLRDISESDAKAEGARSADPATGRECILDPSMGSYRLHYRDIWESINGPGAWDANPWVWVIEFKVLEGGAA